MSKKKVMVASLTALTLLSTGAITTYVANNLLLKLKVIQAHKFKEQFGF